MQKHTEGDGNRPEIARRKSAVSDDFVKAVAPVALPTTSESARVAESERASLRDRMTLDYLVSMLGFGLCRAWIVFCFAAPMIPHSPSASNWIYLVFGALIALAVAFAVKRMQNKIAALRAMMYRVTLSAIIASGILIPLSFALNNEILLMIGFAIGGVGAGLLQVLWGDRFACYPMRFTALASPAAAIVTGLIIALTTDGTSFVGFAVIPLLSFGLLVFEADRTGVPMKQLFHRAATIPSATATSDDSRMKQTPAAAEDMHSDAVINTPQAEIITSGNQGRPGRRGGGLGVGKLMFSIMTFSFLCRLFDAVPTQRDPFDFIGGSVIFALLLVGAVFLLIVILLKERFDPTFTYRLSLPIMVTGFVAIALFVDTHAALSLMLINVGYEFFDILAWILFAEVSRRKSENALHIFGLGVAFMFIGMASGNLAGSAIDALVLNGTVQMTMVAMVATLSLVTVAFMVIPEGVVSQLGHAVRSDKKDDADSSEQEKMPSHENTPLSENTPVTTSRIETHCIAVARDFSLTPRESEVIVLLAYGRTLSIIARDLQIAKGTARTHIENIYRKLDVHKQQELIDLVESYGDLSLTC